MVSKSILKKKITFKKPMKKKMSIKIENYETPSILDDENRFFKGQLQNEKEQFFFK